MSLEARICTRNLSKAWSDSPSWSTMGQRSASPGWRGGTLPHLLASGCVRHRWSCGPTPLREGQGRRRCASQAAQGRSRRPCGQDGCGSIPVAWSRPCARHRTSCRQRGQDRWWEPRPSRRLSWRRLQDPCLVTRQGERTIAPTLLCQSGRLTVSRTPPWQLPGAPE